MCRYLRQVISREDTKAREGDISVQVKGSTQSLQEKDSSTLGLSNSWQTLKMAAQGETEESPKLTATSLP